MKLLNLTKTELRILMIQLESKAEGYTLSELRQVNKVIDSCEKKLDGYDKRLSQTIKSLADNPKELSEAVEKILEDEGTQKVKLPLEDADYNFVKDIWSNTKGFLGNKDTRKSVLAIDDALINPLSPAQS